MRLIGKNKIFLILTLSLLMFTYMRYTEVNSKIQEQNELLVELENKYENTSDEEKMVRLEKEECMTDEYIEELARKLGYIKKNEFIFVDSAQDVVK
ncbi:MAG: septum formation initiator family protein [Clostridia bacterium]|jgi:cell division protein FtsB|nr:septum formation initiator family protein [Clostridia bacterium]